MSLCELDRDVLKFAARDHRCEDGVAGEFRTDRVHERVGVDLKCWHLDTVDDEMPQRNASTAIRAAAPIAKSTP